MTASRYLSTILVAVVSVGLASQEIEIPDWEHAVHFRLISSQVPLRPGDELKLAVLMDIQPGYHLYGPKEKPPSRTEVVLRGDLLPAGKPSFPQAVKRDLAGLGEFDLYEGSVAVQMPVRVPEVALTGSMIDAVVEVKHQVCTNQACSAPTSTVLTLSLPVEKPGHPVQQQHSRVFGRKR